MFEEDSVSIIFLLWTRFSPEDNGGPFVHSLMNNSNFTQAFLETVYSELRIYTKPQY